MSLRHNLIPHHFRAIRVIPRGEHVEIILERRKMQRKIGKHPALGAPYGDPVEPMTEAEAKEFGPQWGCMMRTGDPGSIMYSAIPPEKAEHRDEMVFWLRWHCLPVVECVAPDYSPNYDPDDAINLARMIAYLEGLKY